MGRELTLIPFKVVIELVLYIVLLIYIFFGVRWFKMKLPLKEGHPSVQLCLRLLGMDSILGNGFPPQLVIRLW